MSYFFSHPKSDLSKVDSICLGSGRFLRSVLVPALNAASIRTAIFQTRGSSFLEYSINTFTGNSDGDNEGISNFLSYEVDTVEYDGTVKTENVYYDAAGTLGSDAGKESAMKLLEEMESIHVIGIGVTESGIKSFSQALIHLADILRKCHSLLTSTPPQLKCSTPNGRISVINTDNVPNNGDMIRKYVFEIAKLQNEKHSKDEKGESFLEFLSENGGVTFHNSMVDRITSQRPDSNGIIPRCEPTPNKAIVIEDLQNDLPSSLCSKKLKETYGIIARTNAGQLAGDIALKLRVANGTHTSIAHTMALSSLLLTDFLSNKNNPLASTLVHYLDSLFNTQILMGAELDFGGYETRAVYDDWKRRLCHAHFGLSTFFITQNGAAKAGIRIAPTIRGLVKRGKPITASTIFSLASILRFLTPSDSSPKNPKSLIYRGWLDSSSTFETSPDSHTVTYADGLRYNLSEGWYEFRCDCTVKISSEFKPLRLPNILQFLVKKSSRQSFAFEEVVTAYLSATSGGDMNDLLRDKETSNEFGNIVKAVCALYARMIAGDNVLDLLKEMDDGIGVFNGDGLNTPCKKIVEGTFKHAYNVFNKSVRPLKYRPSSIPDQSALMNCKLTKDHNDTVSVVLAEVAAAKTIDLHTHLLPPSHGDLCLWGIDEMLTYHYLVAEYFMTAPPSISPQDFYEITKQKQADLIWKALFIDRSPISEACRGVITTLEALGLSKQMNERDLVAIRQFYRSFREEGVSGTERFSNLVYQLSGLEHAVMTNIPFDINEAQYWRPKKKDYPKHYRSALRVDPLLAGDRETIENALKASGYEVSLYGARQYLLDWIDTMKPEYVMASTPHNFDWSSTDRGNLSEMKNKGINEEAMKEPFAFVNKVSMGEADISCNGEDDEIASLINEESDFLSVVLMSVCEERDLPIALKIGAHRGINPRLLSAGDGIVAFADGGVLARLCYRFPKVRFLATFLSRNNQHEACVLASKFRNLHIYGCWWYCNNPSIIKEITEMRLEMLGTAFTAQHSDARVLDQLIYKWSHSRSVIAVALAEQYMKLIESGWSVTRREVRRDVNRLFGGAYKEFMKKSLI